MQRIPPSPFVCTFLAGLWLVIGTACRTPSTFSDGSLPISATEHQVIEDPQSAQALAWFGMALHWELRGNYEKSAAAYQNAIENDPENDALYLHATKRLIQAGKQEEAFELLDTLLQRTPENVQALRWKARLLLQQKESEPALETYSLVVGLKPAEEFFYLEAIQAAVQAQDSILALTFAREAYNHADEAKRSTLIYLRLLDAVSEQAIDLQGIADLQDEYSSVLAETLTRYPEESVFNYLDAERALAANNEARALQNYEKIDLHSEDKDEERARILVHAIKQLGDGRKGTRKFRNLANGFPGNALVYYLQGLLWEFQRSNDKAYLAYKQAAALAPTDTPTLRKLAVLTYQKGDATLALSLLDKVLKEEPDNPDMILLSGQIALASQNYTKALEYLSQRLDQQKQGLDLENPASIYGQLAIAQWETGQDQEDVLASLEAAGNAPGAIELAWRQRYQTILRLKEENPDQAQNLEDDLLIIMEDLSDRIPRNPEPAWLTATSYSFRDDYEMALDYLEEVKFRAELSGSSETWLTPDYWFDVAAAQERSGQFDAAVNTFLGIIEKKPDHHSSLNYVAYMWAERGINLDQAQEFVERAMQFDPDNGSYIDTLGWIYYQQGNFDDAYDELLRSAELLPNESVVLEHLGDVLMKLNRPVEARGYYQIALALDAGERVEIVQKSLLAAEQAVATWLSSSRTE